MQATTTRTVKPLPIDCAVALRDTAGLILALEFALQEASEADSSLKGRGDVPGRLAGRMDRLASAVSALRWTLDNLLGSLMSECPAHVDFLCGNLGEPVARKLLDELFEAPDLSELPHCLRYEM